MSMTLNEGSYTQAEQARGTGAPPQRRDGLVRCAIYTRKSTDEGLEQDFNSLDAQRESAEACILSHKHEGWVCLPDRYDDGGFTGGNMERPALKRLLTDIEAGEMAFKRGRPKPKPKDEPSAPKDGTHEEAGPQTRPPALSGDGAPPDEGGEA